MTMQQYVAIAAQQWQQCAEAEFARSEDLAVTVNLKERTIRRLSWTCALLSVALVATWIWRFGCAKH